MLCFKIISIVTKDPHEHEQDEEVKELELQVDDVKGRIKLRKKYFLNVLVVQVWKNSG